MTFFVFFGVHSMQAWAETGQTGSRRGGAPLSDAISAVRLQSHWTTKEIPQFFQMLVPFPQFRRCLMDRAKRNQYSLAV